MWCACSAAEARWQENARPGASHKSKCSRAFAGRGATALWARYSAAGSKNMAARLISAHTLSTPVTHHRRSGHSPNGAASGAAASSNASRPHLPPHSTTGASACLSNTPSRLSPEIATLFNQRSVRGAMVCLVVHASPSHTQHPGAQERPPLRALRCRPSATHHSALGWSVLPSSSANSSPRGRPSDRQHASRQTFPVLGCGSCCHSSCVSRPDTIMPWRDAQHECAAAARGWAPHLRPLHGS